jgi:hypothetical protein
MTARAGRGHYDGSVLVRGIFKLEAVKLRPQQFYSSCAYFYIDCIPIELYRGGFRASQETVFDFYLTWHVLLPDRQAATLTFRFSLYNITSVVLLLGDMHYKFGARSSSGSGKMKGPVDRPKAGARGKERGRR